jgi:hypothetical protein
MAVKEVSEEIVYKSYPSGKNETNEETAGQAVSHPASELAGQVNQQCMELQERIERSALVIVHVNNEVYETIRKCLDEACGGVASEQSLRECARVVTIIRVLTGVDKNGTQVCPILMRLLTEELGHEPHLDKYLEQEYNIAVNRLGIAPEVSDAVMREAMNAVGNGEPCVIRILNAINNLAKKRVRPEEFAGFVKDAVLDEETGKLTIHIVIPGAKPESFDVTIKRGEVGLAYITNADRAVWVTDIARGPRLGRLGEVLNGNVRVVVPRMLVGDVDRFLRHGLIPDFTTVELYEAIKEVLDVVRTPEERLREAVGSAFAKFVWVTVTKNKTGANETDSDLAGEPQAYAYLLPDEVWLPHYLWTILRGELEKHSVMESKVKAWVKEMRTSRSIVRKWDGRSVTIKNVVVLDRAKIEKVLGGSVEDFIIHTEATSNEWLTEGDLA